MSERLRPLVVARNAIAAAALVPAGAFFNVENSAGQVDTHPQQNIEVTDNSLLKQLDEFVETDYGRALVASVLALSVANAIYTLQARRETDDNKKYALSAAATALLFGISSVFFYESFGDVKPEVPASLIEGYVLTQGMYNAIDARQRHKFLRKRLPAYASSAAMIAVGSTLLVETLK